MAVYTTHEQRVKLDTIKSALAVLDGVAVSFSGGVDSTLLLSVAQEVLGDRVLAVTVDSVLYPQRETNEATQFCADRGIEQIFVQTEIGSFAHNPEDRCYHCKNKMFQAIRAAADARALELGWISEGGHIAILEGSNFSDRSDYRPGFRAVKEQGILSPLDDAELTKQDIRDLSRDRDLPTWRKPSFACLATRIPYGEQLDPDLLDRIATAEQMFIDAGFRTIRVRVYDGGTSCRIEVHPNRVDRAYNELKLNLGERLRELGFKHIALDMDGYQSGYKSRMTI